MFQRITALPQYQAKTTRIAITHHVTVGQRQIEMIVFGGRGLRLHHPQSSRHAQMHDQCALNRAKQQVFTAAFEFVDALPQ